MHRFKKRLKRLSPVVLKTVKKAKKGIYRTVKFAQKTAKGDIEETTVKAWVVLLQMIANLAVKTVKQTIRKGRLPKVKFLQKQFQRAGGYFTVLPLILVLVI
jgi:hypothetical protein